MSPSEGFGRYSVPLGERTDVVIGDRYYGPTAADIRAIVQATLEINTANDTDPIDSEKIGQYSLEIAEKTTKQIEHLRSRLIQLISAREAVLNLSQLRQPMTSLKSLKSITQPEKLIKASLPFGIGTVEKEEGGVESYLEELIALQSEISSYMNYEDLPKLQSRLRLLTDKINIDIYRVYSIFISFLYPAISSKELMENLSSKLGDKELREEAKIHTLAVQNLISRLDENQLLSKSMEDVLGEEATIAMGVMAEITHRRILVEALIREDRQKRINTIRFVSGYIFVVILLLGIFYFIHGVNLQLGEKPLGEMRLPFFGIPWPVVLWSLIGSIAAMIYQFNKKPISDFGDATKWMLTRPIQGVILGSTFYLVLISGLFLLTGTNPSSTSGSVRVDEIILVLVFLVGFSDRFADAVFNTLVERFSNDAKERPNNDANSNHNESQ